MARLRAAGILALPAAVLIVVLAAPTARAHTQVQRATPGPGAVVTGPVGQVELQFLDPVVPSVQIAVQDTDGRVVAGLGEVEHTDDGRVATVGFDALERSGNYVVDYEFVALDGDAQADGYRFSITDDDADRGRSLVGPVIGGVVALVVLGALAVAFRRRRTVDG